MEHSILIIKPDGVQKNIYDNICIELKRESLLIKKEKKKVLKFDIVYNNFNSKFEKYEYSKYLSSGVCHAILVYGENAAHKCRLIKYRIRNKYKINSEDMKNLLHNSDPGKEYTLQFPIFFEELTLHNYPIYADMLVNIEHFKNAKEMNAKNIAVVSPKVEELNSIMEQNCNVLIGYIYKLFDVYDTELIIYSNKKIPQKIENRELNKVELKKQGYLVSVNVKNLKHLEYIKNIIDEYNIKIANIYLPDNELYDIEIMEKYIDDYLELRFSGGSYNIYPFTNMIGQYEYEKAFGELI